MSYTVILDDISLADVSSHVRIVDAVELQPSRTISARELLGAPGSILTRNHINTRQVRVQFAILTSSPTLRTAALSAISAWATQGKYLKLGDRPGQQLRVVCTETPLTMSKRKWTELCEMTFTAFHPAFWEDVNALDVTADGITAADVPITPRGNVSRIPLMCTVTPTSGSLTALTISANGAEMAFSGLAVPAGNSFTLDYREDVLVANYTAEDGSVVPCLSCRIGNEGIPLFTRQENTVHITADAACNVILHAKGWYW